MSQDQLDPRIDSQKDHNGHTVELPTKQDIVYANLVNQCRARYYANNSLKQLAENKRLVSKVNQKIRDLRDYHRTIRLAGRDGGIHYDGISDWVPLRKDAHGFYFIPVRVDYEKGLVIYSEPTHSRRPPELQTPEEELCYDSEVVECLVGDRYFDTRRSDSYGSPKNRTNEG